MYHSVRVVRYVIGLVNNCTNKENKAPLECSGVQSRSATFAASYYSTYSQCTARTVQNAYCVYKQSLHNFIRLHNSVGYKV